MPVVTFLDLSSEARSCLEKGARHGATYRFRQRCQMVLLKSDPQSRRTSAEVGLQVGCCEPVVNTWLERYAAAGIDGLRSKKSSGRPPLLHKETDLEAVRRAVQANRQRVSLAKAELETALDKRFSAQTLTRFLKKTVDASDDCESA